MKHDPLSFVEEGDRVILSDIGEAPDIYEVVDADPAPDDCVLCNVVGGSSTIDEKYPLERVDVELADRVTVDTRDGDVEELSGRAKVEVRLGFEDAVGGEMDDKIIETLKEEFDTIGDLDIYHV